MYNIEDIINTIICGHSLDVLKQIPTESIHMAMTSPPYWGKRSYKTTPLIWDGKPDCQHDFSIETEAGDIRYRPGYNADIGFCYNPDVWVGDGKGHICSICGAWMGELGHEPTPELFISHLCKIFDEVNRVLKKEGSLWVNIGETYWGGGNASGHTEETKQFGTSKTLERGYLTNPIAKGNYYPSKSQCCIPERFAMEMCNPNWVLREDLTLEEKQYVLAELLNRGLL